MIYALLAAAVTPTATLVPITTQTPAPLLVSIVKDTTDKTGFWDTFVQSPSFIISIAALLVSIIALIATIKQQKRANKIAVMDKAFDIYNFFLKEVIAYDYLTNDKDAILNFTLRQAEIGYVCLMLFKTKTKDRLHELLAILQDIKEFSKKPNNDRKAEYLRMAEEYKFTDLIDDKDDELSHQITTIKRHIRRSARKIFEDYRLNL